MRTNKAQKRLEKIKIQRTIFSAITTLLSSPVKKKSFGMYSFFGQDAKLFFRTNDLPQIIDDYLSIIDSITHSSITEKSVSLFLGKELLRHLQMLQSVHRIFLFLERRLKSLISFTEQAEVFFSILFFTNEQACLTFSRKMYLQCLTDKPHLLFIHFYLSMLFLIIVIFSDCFLLFRFF